MMTALLAMPAWAQEENSSPLQFDTYEWDFGNIKEEDGIVTHTFTFMNVSNNPIQIDNVATSCGCTTAQFSTDDILPGKTGEIVVHFSPARTEGKVFREIDVMTRGRRSFDHLSVTADVEPMPMGLPQLYPHVLKGEIRTNAKRCNFGYVALGSEMEKVVAIANSGDKTVRLTAKTANTGNGMTVKCPEKVEPEEIVYLHIKYDIPDRNENYGMARDTVWVYADGVKSDEPIVVNALRVDDFTGRENKPKPVMRIEPGYIDFGEKPAGKTYRMTITIENTGNADLVFHDVEACEGTTASIRDGLHIKPGKQQKVTVSLYNSAAPGETLYGSVNLTTNDPTRPFRELRLQIQTKK